MKTQQQGAIRTVRFRHWTSMFQETAAAAILEQIAWIETDGNFRFVCGEGSDLVLLVHCIRGAGSVQLRGRSYRFGKGQTMVFSILDGYTARAVSQDFRFVWMLMRGDLAREMTRHLTRDRGMVIPASEKILPLCETVYSAVGPEWTFEGEIRIAEGLYRIFTELMLCSHDRQQLAPAVRYIEEHSAGDVPVPLLAELCYLSVSRFIVRFKETYSVTPNQYLVNTRIDRAKAELLGTEKPMELIAQETGFRDGAYFSRMFKKVCGMTPGQYRKMLS